MKSRIFLAAVIAVLLCLEPICFAQAGPTVQLGWTPSTTPSVSYNVYQETSSGACTSTITGAGPGCLRLNQTPINPAPNSAGQIIYTIIPPVGAKLWWTVRAVNAVGIESVNSAEVSLDLSQPAPPGAPSCNVTLPAGSTVTVTCK